MKNDKHVPVNKGNYSLDTPEREARFEEIRGSGHSEAYKQNRKDWYSYPQNLEVPEYPLHLDIELSSMCNLHCPMCYTITEPFKQKVNAKLMDFELFKKIIAEISGKVFSIRLSLRGEATLHPKFFEAIHYAKDNGILEVSSLSNGSRLKKMDWCKKLVNSGLDWLTVSADGVGETYNKIRSPIKFEDIIQGLSNLKTAKEEAGTIIPAVKVQGIWPAMQEDPDVYYEAYAPISDLVAFNPLVDYMREIPENILAYEENFACSMLYQRLVIGADGKVMICSNDEETDHPIGNSYDSTIHELWHSKEMQSYRELHLGKDGFKKIDICRRCYMPRATIEEQSSVRGRPLIVRNYLNNEDFTTSIDNIQKSS
jgi:radical SAM protein with 4Fe4S-binding SPASM domain